jgi:hypothetical protein
MSEGRTYLEEAYINDKIYELRVQLLGIKGVESRTVLRRTVSEVYTPLNTSVCHNYEKRPSSSWSVRN